MLPRLQSIGKTSCTQDLSGKRRAFSPKYSGDVLVDYDRPIFSDLHLRLNGTVYFTSKFFQQPLADPTLQQAGYAKIDARAAVGPANGRWEAAIIAKNLTDKRTGSYRQPVGTAPGSIQVLADPPRTVGMQVSFKF